MSASTLPPSKGRGSGQRHTIPFSSLTMRFSATPSPGCARTTAEDDLGLLLSGEMATTTNSSEGDANPNWQLAGLKQVEQQKKNELPPKLKHALIFLSIVVCLAYVVMLGVCGVAFGVSLEMMLTAIEGNDEYQRSTCLVLGHHVSHYQKYYGAGAFTPTLEVSYTPQGQSDPIVAECFEAVVFPSYTMPDAEEWLRGFPINTSCECFYDPKDHSQVVISKDIPDVAIVGLVIGVLMLAVLAGSLLGVLCLVSRWRQLHQKSESKESVDDGTAMVPLTAATSEEDQGV